MLILISIGVVGYGLYLTTNSHPQAGIVMTAAGVFSFFLALRISDLKDRLDWATAENQKLSKKAEKLIPKPGVTKLQQKLTEVSEPQSYVPKVPPKIDDYLKPLPEKSIWADPNPNPSKQSPLRDKTDPPKIVTRTSRATGGNTQETWKGERDWSQDEVSNLIKLYSSGEILDSIAIKMRLDKKDVVCKLTRLNFGEYGDLEDLSEAWNDGKTWSKEDSKKLLAMNAAGITLNGMAKTFGRTKLAIGWRLADQRELRNIG